MLEGLDTQLEKVECLQNVLVDRATGGAGDDAVFKLVRLELLRDEELKPLVPKFLKTCREQSQFWQFIKNEFPSYAERRRFIWDQFAPLLNHLEGGQAAPSDSHVTETLQELDAQHVHEAWVRALDRRQDDPDGAITSARALLESVCKHILDDAGIDYDADTVKLPRLYATTSKHLGIAPSQHTEEVFRQILGGCSAVVEGLGTMRNRLGDAHGKGASSVKPAPRHAELAVNLAGAMATFLVQTWAARSDRTQTGAGISGAS